MKGAAYVTTRWHVQSCGVQNGYIRMFMERKSGWKEDSEQFVNVRF